MYKNIKIIAVAIFTQEVNINKIVFHDWSVNRSAQIVVLISIFKSDLTPFFKSLIFDEVGSMLLT